MKEFRQLDGFRRNLGMKRADLIAIRELMKKEIKKTDEEIASIKRHIDMFEKAMADRGREIEERAE